MVRNSIKDLNITANKPGFFSCIFRQIPVKGTYGGYKVVLSFDNLFEECFTIRFIFKNPLKNKFHITSEHIIHEVLDLLKKPSKYEIIITDEFMPVIKSSGLFERLKYLETLIVPYYNGTFYINNAELRISLGVAFIPCDDNIMKAAKEVCDTIISLPDVVIN